jgi:hypothetical protein
MKTANEGDDAQLQTPAPFHATTLDPQQTHDRRPTPKLSCAGEAGVNCSDLLGGMAYSDT